MLKPEPYRPGTLVWLGYDKCIAIILGSHWLVNGWEYQVLKRDGVHWRFGVRKLDK